MPETREPAENDKLHWRVLIEARGRSGPENMALDQQLLEEVELRDDCVAYLRLYRWEPPCLSFGRNERALVRYHRPLIEELNLAVVRRPTGGRAVWHDQEVTYSVVAPVVAFGSLRESYRAVHARLLQALRKLGVPGSLSPEPGRAAPLDFGPCFSAPVGGEIVIDGKKLVGSAQVRLKRAFLQHGSILLDGDQRPVVSVTRGSSAAVHLATLRQTLGREVSFDEVARAIVAAWAVSGETLELVRDIPIDTRLPTFFSSPDWIWRR